MCIEPGFTEFFSFIVIIFRIPWLKIIQGSLEILQPSFRNIKQRQYGQTAKHRFLFAWNGLNIRCSNTVFYIYLRNLVWNWGKFSIFALVHSMLLHFCNKFYSVRKTKTTLLHFIFMGFYATKNVCYDFLEKIPKSTLYNNYIFFPNNFFV